MFVIDIAFLIGWIGGSVSIAIIQYLKEEKNAGTLFTIFVIAILYAMILLILKGVING